MLFYSERFDLTISIGLDERDSHLSLEMNTWKGRRETADDWTRRHVMTLGLISAFNVRRALARRDEHTIALVFMALHVQGEGIEVLLSWDEGQSKAHLRMYI